MMKIKYIQRDKITEKQKEDLNIIYKTCFPIDEGSDDIYNYGTIELGKYLLFEGERIVGQVDVHKRLTEYDGKEYYIGGLGGLAVMPEYRGNGYARRLSEEALKMSYDVGVDVACLCVNRKKGVYHLYESFGYKFLNRNAYFVNGLGIEKTDNSVMIMGLNNRELADKILNTNHKFHYGNEEGYW